MNKHPLSVVWKDCDFVQLATYSPWTYSSPLCILQHGSCCDCPQYHQAFEGGNRELDCWTFIKVTEVLYSLYHRDFTTVIAYNSDRNYCHQYSKLSGNPIGKYLSSYCHESWVSLSWLFLYFQEVNILKSRNIVVVVQSKLGGSLGRVWVMTIWPESNVDFVPSHIVLGGMKAKAQKTIIGVRGS